MDIFIDDARMDRQGNLVMIDTKNKHTISIAEALLNGAGYEKKQPAQQSKVNAG